LSGPANKITSTTPIGKKNVAIAYDGGAAHGCPPTKQQMPQSSVTALD
jgi:hypothetical protein